MMPDRISQRVAADRLEILDVLIEAMRAMPYLDRQHFLADRGNVFVAQSHASLLLKIFFDVGRHILTEGYGLGTSEYQEIAAKLYEQGALDQQEADLLRRLAEYHNRQDDFEEAADLLYDIRFLRLGDIELVQTALRRWLREHPEKLDQVL